MLCNRRICRPGLSLTLLKVLLRSLPAAHQVRQALGKCGCVPTAQQSRATIGDGTVKPVCVLGGFGWASFCLGISVLGVFGFQEQIAKFFLYLPRLFAALLTMFFGLLAAGFFSRAALLAAVNANLPSPRLLSVSVRTIIIIFVLSMVFEEVGVAEETVLVAFGIAFGALMLGLAIAFGMGGKDLAQQFLERRFGQERKDEEKEDELSPL